MNYPVTHINNIPVITRHYRCYHYYYCNDPLGVIQLHIISGLRLLIKQLLFSNFSFLKIFVHAGSKVWRLFGSQCCKYQQVYGQSFKKRLKRIKPS